MGEAAWERAGKLTSPTRGGASMIKDKYKEKDKKKDNDNDNDKYKYTNKNTKIQNTQRKIQKIQILSKFCSILYEQTELFSL